MVGTQILVFMWPQKASRSTSQHTIIATEVIEVG